MTASQDHGSLHAAHSGVSPVQRALLRRLMIRCPVTGSASDTGLDLSAVPSVRPAGNLLVDCLECGQDHPWRIEDTFLE